MTSPVEEGAPPEQDSEKNQGEGVSAEIQPSPTEASDSLSEETLYSILAEPRRRNTIHYLKQRGEPVAVGELAGQIAAWEYGKLPEELTAKERKRVYISLYQAHLPTMDKAGVVEYDSDRGQVRLTQEATRHRIYLEVVRKNDIPWNVYYIGLSVAGICLIGLAWFEVFPFATVPDLIWAVLILILFGGSAFLQTYSTRQREVGDPGPPPDID